MTMMYKDATIEEVNIALSTSKKAFTTYSKLSLTNRAHFLKEIAKELGAISKELIEIASRDTNLAGPRLEVELTRTIFQLTSYAQACEEGTWLDLRIDTAKSAINSAGIDLRKMYIPLGPVVVFGASNFPFAYSTAGGDTACALAAGCTVIIKAHAAHAATSERVAIAVQKAARQCNLSKDVFIHLHGAAFETGKALVMHPDTAAVGFTGSFEGGKALFDLANSRQLPIPVFAEMGSVNPVFILPGILKEEAEKLAKMYVSSITQSVGQFCTNPGIIVAIEGEGLANFTNKLSDGISETKPAKMLHPGIASNFLKKRIELLKQNGVLLMAQTKYKAQENESIPTIAEVNALEFLVNPILHKEVFGPFSLIVKCSNQMQLLEVAQKMEGQLTATLLATKEEVAGNDLLIEALKQICGRLIFNGVPTGVQVALSMQHGGPFPATTDSRFTAVGADGIKRFSRPVCYQGWPDELVPPELKNANPLNLWRTVNNELTKKPIA